LFERLGIFCIRGLRVARLLTLLSSQLPEDVSCNVADYLDGMVKPGVTDGPRPVSPPVRVKREGSEDGQEETRRVAQRTEENQTANGTLAGPAPVIDAVASINGYVKTISKSDNENVIKDTMIKLADSLSEEDQRPEKKRAFLSVGGPITIVTKLDKYTNNEYIESNGIRVLINATWKDVNNQLRSAIADVDGIEAIVEAMTIHSASSEIQRRGLSALRNISILKENAEKLVLEIEIIPMIIQTMTIFSDDVEVTTKACGLLKKLSSYEKLHKPMVDAKVVSALARAIEEHENNEDIQHRARKAIKQLL
jgi:hypothetical protein